MPSDLEKDINEIKISVARIEEKLKIFDSHIVMFMDYERRLRQLEDFKSKFLGYSAALGAVGGFIAAIFIKII